MHKINHLAVVVAAVTAFVVSSLWYIAFGGVRAELHGIDTNAAAAASMPPVLVLAEYARSLIVAYVLARLASLLRIVDWRGAVRLGVGMWIGFPVVLLTGSVLHENVPWGVAALHAGDWLLKLLLLAVIVSVWRRRGDVTADDQRRGGQVSMAEATAQS
jgi:hypothetical protein